MERDLIRQAVLSDAARLYALDHAARGDADRRSWIDRAIREARSWVIERHDVVLGYGIMSHEFFGRSFVDLIYVDEHFRGQGLGPKLIRALEQQSKSTSLFTSTNQSNLHMQHVLEGLGYEPSGIIHNLDPGDPELVYVKHGLRASR
jgi:ribosomal protein S18 acetylase RimI-like enzyme